MDIENTVKMLISDPTKGSMHFRWKQDLRGGIDGNFGLLVFDSTPYGDGKNDDMKEILV